ncbi:uncharacterized protein LOC142948347 isoform X1 [Anarhichas minor]|uniref:uncharacterized protein LOC142948347 isoform X1 n=1 Tax=Anarhichas minor TaxID=65739 RepID=UPI003F73BE29
MMANVVNRGINSSVCELSTEPCWQCLHVPESIACERLTPNNKSFPKNPVARGGGHFKRECVQKVKGVSNTETKMPTWCIVPGCSSYKKKREELVSVNYHRLPTDVVRCKQWLRAIKNPKYDENAPTSALGSLRVCSLHFAADDYNRDMRSELMGGPIKKLLKTSAVPAVFTSDVGRGEAEPREERGRTDTEEQPACTSTVSASSCETETRSAASAHGHGGLVPEACTSQSTIQEKHEQLSGVPESTPKQPPVKSHQASKLASQLKLELSPPREPPSTSGAHPAIESELHDTWAVIDRPPGQVTSTGIQVNVPETCTATMEKPTVQHIVDEEAILQLMKNCPMCDRKCRCTKRTCDPYFIVYQSCYFCNYQRKWANQPEARDMNIQKANTPPKKKLRPKNKASVKAARTQSSQLLSKTSTPESSVSEPHCSLET